MKKIIIALSIFLSLACLSSAIDIVLNSGEKLSNNNWNDLSSILNKVDVSSGDLKINGKLSINGKVCLDDGSCLGECSGLEIWDTNTNSCIIPATTPETAGETCKTIKDNNSGAADGLYYIKPAGYTGEAFQVYCDMTTDGGGWTLMYRYTFTTYNSFAAGSNAVTPIPNWGYSSTNVPNSTTPPTNTNNGAINFSLWNKLSTNNQTLTKSNITNWYRCSNSALLLANKQNGNISCVMQNNIMNVGNYVPNSIVQNSYGPYFQGSSLFIYYAGMTTGNRPTHDPYGNNGANQKKGVANPYGELYFR